MTIIISQRYLKDPDIEDQDKEGQEEPDKLAFHYVDTSGIRLRYNYEIWRLIIPVLFHKDLSHLFTNLILQVTFGIVLEYTIGSYETLLIYFFSSIGGHLAASFFSPEERAVGASNSIYGLVVSVLVLVIINWKSFNDENCMKLWRCYWVFLASGVLIW